MAKMTSRKPERIVEWPWSVPLALADVPETGRHLELAADEYARAAIAKLAGLRALPRLAATFDVALRGRGGLRVSGQVSATVGQVCVVTIEPVDNEIEEEVELSFASDAGPALASQGEAEAEEGPETLVDGTVDLGAIATEFLLLAIDPYPRKSGAVFEPPAKLDAGNHPFAALAALKKGRGGEGG
jgi:uncharacterized metal-binding protein YceD (DUF177 family)